MLLAFTLLLTPLFPNHLLVSDVADVVVNLCWNSLQNRVFKACPIYHFALMPIDHNYLDTIFRKIEFLAVDLDGGKDSS